MSDEPSGLNWNHIEWLKARLKAETKRADGNYKVEEEQRNRALALEARVKELEAGGAAYWAGLLEKSASWKARAEKAEARVKDLDEMRIAMMKHQRVLRSRAEKAEVAVAESDRLLELTWPFLGFETTEGRSLESLRLDIQHHLKRAAGRESGRSKG